MSIPSPSAELGHHSDDETGPFLLRELSDPLAPSQPEDTDGQNSGRSKRPRPRLLITLIVILLSFEIGGQMITGPMVQLIETIACDNYWRRHHPARLPATGHLPEHLCKIAPVQAEVATVKGYSDLLEGLLCAICALPYGILADRYGRRGAIRLTIPGFFLNALITNSVLWFSNALPLRAIWLAAFSWIIGGGPSVALILIWTMLADLSTEAQRAALFFRVGLASQIASFFASTISSGLMTMNPWIPLLGGCGTVAIGLCCALSLPETMNTVSKTTESKQSFPDKPLSKGESSLGSGPIHRVRLIKIFQLICPYLFIFNHRLLLLLFSFGIVQVAQTSSSFLTQYISTCFTWTLARAHFLASFHMAITIPVFLFLLPFLSNKVFHSLSLPRRDLLIARFSDIALILGSLGIGLSPSVVSLIPSICLYATGAGFSLVTRSLVTTLVKREETARLYSAIELMQLMGGVLGSLCFTNAFNSGLRMSGIGAGLVWMLASLLYALVGIALAFVRV